MQPTSTPTDCKVVPALVANSLLELMLPEASTELPSCGKTGPITGTLTNELAHTEGENGIIPPLLCSTLATDLALVPDCIDDAEQLLPKSAERLWILPRPTRRPLEPSAPVIDTACEDPALGLLCAGNADLTAEDASVLFIPPFTATSEASGCSAASTDRFTLLPASWQEDATRLSSWFMFWVRIMSKSSSHPSVTALPVSTSIFRRLSGGSWATVPPAEFATIFPLLRPSFDMMQKKAEISTNTMKKLHPRTDYCRMVRQHVKVFHSIISHEKANKIFFDQVTFSNNISKYKALHWDVDQLVLHYNENLKAAVQDTSTWTQFKIPLSWSWVYWCKTALLHHKSIWINSVEK